MNAAQTLLPLVGFLSDTVGKEVVLVNPQTVVSVLEVRGGDNPACSLRMVDSSRVDVKGNLLATRQALQGNPWYATNKLSDFLEEADEYFADREDADEGQANAEMRLRSQLMTVRSLLREHGFVK